MDDQYVKYAAQFAVDAKNSQNKKANEDALEYSLENIVKAQQQVVAFMKFYVCMELYAASKTDGEDRVQFFALAEVYRNLKNEYSSVGWSEPESCD